MPNKFYLRNTTQTSAGTLPPSNQSVDIAQTPTQIVSGTNRVLDNAIGAGQTSLVLTTQPSGGQASLIGRWVSDPIAAQTISAQTITLSGARAESNLNSNFLVTPYLVVYRPSTGNMVGSMLFLNAFSMAENTSAGTQQAASIAPTSSSVTAQDQDVIVLEIWRNTTAQSMNTSYTNTWYFDGTTEASASNVASFINFGTTNIKLQPSGWGQAQAKIKQTHDDFAQAQANILQVYRGYAQAQANIKQTYNSPAQAQALIIKFTNGYAQAMARIGPTTYERILKGIAGLQSFWTLGEPSTATSIADYQGAITGTVNGTPTFSQPSVNPQQLEPSIRFTAVSQYLTFGDNYDSVGTTLTVLAWVYHTGSWSSTKEVIVSKQGAANDNLRVTGSNSGYSLDAYNAARFNNNELPDTWQFVLSSYNDVTDDAVVYVDDIKQASTNLDKDLTNTTTDFTIARDAYDSSGRFNGLIGSVAIFNTTVSFDDFQALYTVAKSGAIARPAQAQAKIKVTNIEGFAQAQAHIITSPFGQAQARILQTYNTFAQAQTRILQTYNLFAQAQALIAAQIASDTFQRTVSSGWGASTPTGEIVWTNRDALSPGFIEDGSVSGSYGIAPSGIIQTRKKGYPLLKRGMVQFDFWVPANINSGGDYNIDSRFDGVQATSNNNGTWSIKEVFNTDFNYIFTPDASSWYTVKFTTGLVGDLISAKVWKVGTDEPGWQTTGVQTQSTLSPLYFSVESFSAEEARIDNIIFWTTDNDYVFSSDQQFAQAQAFIILKQNGRGQSAALIAGTYFVPFSDTFTRSVTDGLGTSDNGDAWVLRQGTAANADVNGSKATIITSTAQVWELRSTLIDLFQDQGFEFSGEVSLDKLPATQTLSITWGMRSAGSSTSHQIGGGVSITPTIISSFALRFGSSQGSTSSPSTANDTYKFKIHVIKSSGADNRGLIAGNKFWKLGDPEPGWNTYGDSAVSTAQPFPDAGYLRLLLSNTSDANAPFTWTIDNLEVKNAWIVRVGQAQAVIKRAYTAPAQAQAQIKQVYNGYGQAEAEIEVNAAIIDAYAQAQARILTTYNAFAQAQAKILTTYNQYAQAQADILKTYDAYAQAQADIKATYNSYAQAQAWIEQTYNGFAQAQANIKAIYNTFAQAQAYLRAFDVEGFSQVQARIGGQGPLIYLRDTFTRTLTDDMGQADTGQVYDGFNSLHGFTINGSNLVLEVESGGGNNLQTYIYRAGEFTDTTIDVRISTPTDLNYWTVDLNMEGLGFSWEYWDENQSFLFLSGLSSGENELFLPQIEFDTWYTIKSRIDQTRTSVKIWKRNDPEPEEWALEGVKASGYDYGLSKISIYLDIQTGLSTDTIEIDNLLVTEVLNVHYGQAQAVIKQTYNSFAQSQAQIKQTYNSFAQAQARIKQTYTQYAQAQARILTTYQAYGQAQADIKQTYNGYAQSQAWIEQTYNLFAQAQGTILAVEEGFSQAQAQILQTYDAYAQAQAKIIVTINRFAQAQALIYIPITLRPVEDVTVSTGIVGVVV